MSCGQSAWKKAIADALLSTVGAGHRRYLRLQPSPGEALPDPERRPHGHGSHLDPVVPYHQAP
jgi:hypothetical protein